MLYNKPPYQGKKPPKTVRLVAVGWDGFLMLSLSVVWIFLTLGVAYLWALGRTLSFAVRTPSSVAKPATAMVFGVNLNGGSEPGRLFVTRLKRALELHPENVLLLGGHTHPNSPHSEAEAGRQWLIAHGVPNSRITMEDSSVNTLENLYGVRDFLKSNDDVRPCLVTSRFHIARTSMLAHGLGIDHVCCAAEERFCWNVSNMSRVALEAFFINWYVVGRWVSSALGHDGMLQRIS